MAHTALAPVGLPVLPRALQAVAQFWTREDGFRHAAYISGGLFVTVAAIKLLTA
ncbi:hypothetical protein C8J30_11543 [Rhodobacter viridis]|uniref:Uncharacterized protein n=1 Tax=Rhodobacter viridis TaxID=1054202 RepID=A0A318TVC5_9RHOB|nr:hypothetical protein [Rhodobacter viridis]PYF07797.1 hypothetical protein C8J30_11543 [Rhodobacter viridis]